MTVATHTIAASEHEHAILREEVATLRQTFAWFKKRIIGPTLEWPLKEKPPSMDYLSDKAATVQGRSFPLTPSLNVHLLDRGTTTY